MVRFPFGKYGMEIDPTGEYVALEYGARILLGEIVSVRRHEVLGCVLATVRHFNGEMWPIDPAVSQLDWIQQDVIG